MTREQVIQEARTWLGTPWRHQGRLKGIACDCAGLVIEVGKATRLLPTDGSMDHTDYGRQPDPVRIKGVLDRYFDTVEWKGQELPADVLWMRGGKFPQHLGILTDSGTLIHAVDSHSVVEHHIDGYWSRKIFAIYRYRGLDG